QHIEAKYVERRFVDRTWRPPTSSQLAEAFERISHAQAISVADKKAAAVPVADAFWTPDAATALLFAAIETSDMTGVMRAVALGASVGGGQLELSSSGFRASALLAALFGADQLTRVLGLLPDPVDPTAPFRARLEIAELLILNGASVNAADSERGLTPLHVACLADSAGVAKYLADKGADPLVLSGDGRLALAMVLPQSGEAGAPSATRAVVAGVTQRAEERVRQDAALRSPVHHNAQPAGRSAFEARHSGSTDAGDRPLFDFGRSENSVFSAARRFTQSLAPGSSAMSQAGSRMSVSTERPSLMEIGGGSNGGGSSQSSSGWLASLTGGGSNANKRGRRLTSGIRELGSRFANGAVPPGSVDIAGARGADTGCGADVPPLPTILSAREEEFEDNDEDNDEDDGDEGDFEALSGGASRSAPDVAVAAPSGKIPVPAIPDDEPLAEHSTVVQQSSVRSTRSTAALNPSRGSSKHRNITPVYQLFSGSGARSAATSPITSPTDLFRSRRSESSSFDSEANSFVEVIDTPTVRASKHTNSPATVLHRRDYNGGGSNFTAAIPLTPHNRRRRQRRDATPPPVPPLPDSPQMSTVSTAVGSESKSGGSGNKLMMRLLPRSSRMAFTGIFGRSNDRKAGVVQAEPL
ncbi:hypothetical protein IWW38_002248, partial [Coemansia aciculifera]